MGGIYGGTSSSGGGIFGGAPAPSHHHSFLGKIIHGAGSFTGHLLGDARDMAVGLPTGLAMLARHPIRGVETMAKTTWHDWSPLFHGHFKQFGHQFMAHPLAPLLDVAGLVTGGAGLAARAGEGAAELGLISKTSKLGGLSGRFDEASRLEKVAAGNPLAESKLTKVVKHEGAPAAYRHFDHNPVVRARQQALVNIGHKLSEVAPNWFGRSAELTDEGRTLKLGADGRVDPAQLDKVREIRSGKIADLTDAGFSKRYFAKQESYRAGATHAMIGASIAAFVKTGKKIVDDPRGVAKMIEHDGRQQLVDHAYRISHADAKRLKRGFVFVKANPRALPAVHDLDSYEAALKEFGNRHTTTNIEDAARDAKGQYLIVHKRGVLAYKDEAVNSSKFLAKLYKYPTQAWKYAVLATRPAYFVNNAVGNTFMAFATLGPIGFARGLADAYRQVHGEARAARDLEAATKALPAKDWQNKWFLGVHQGFGSEAMSRLRLASKVKGHPRLAQVVKVGEQGFYPITHKVADVFLRRVMINKLMHDDVKVRELMKGGRSFDDAAGIVAKDPAVRDRIQQQVNDALGDYHHLNPLEKRIRDFVPFYTWDRAIMRHGIHLALDRSGRAAVGGAVGQMGTAETEKLLGEIPDFMKGLVVLPHQAGGRQSVLSTTGLNPYASIPDVLDSAGALVGVGSAQPGSVLASQLNPLITGAIETATGQSLLSGAKLPRRPGGILGQTADNLVEGLPQIKLLETLLGGESQPKPNSQTGAVTPFLYRKDAESQLLQLLGIPLKQLDVAQANADARKAKGEHKSRSTGIF